MILGQTVLEIFQELFLRRSNEHDRSLSHKGEIPKTRFALKCGRGHRGPSGPLNCLFLCDLAEKLHPTFSLFHLIIDFTKFGQVTTKLKSATQEDLTCNDITTPQLQYNKKNVY